jgi:hypothetical protein
VTILSKSYQEKEEEEGRSRGDGGKIEKKVDNFLSIFPPSPPLFHFSSFPWRLLLETLSWCHLYCVITYIYSLLIDKDPFGNSK